MRANTVNGQLAFVVVAIAAGMDACGQVRPGSYQGSLPAPITIEVPRTADFQAAIAQAEALRSTMPTVNPSLSVSVRSWTLTWGREWSYAGQSVDWTSTWDPGAPTVQGSVWPALASALDLYPPEGAGYAPSLAAGMIEVTASGLLATDVNHILFAALQDVSVQPIGPAGPTLEITRGYHVFERDCTPAGYATFREVPLDVVSRPIQTGTVGSTEWLSPIDPFVTACGVDATAPIDLGNVAVSPPVTQPAMAQSFTDFQAFAWAPSADVVYVLAGFTGYPPVTLGPSAQVQRLAIGDVVTTVVTSDNVAPPLTVATGGSSLLFWREGINHWDYIRQALLPAVTPLQLPLLDPVNPGPQGESQTALSSDGNLLATASTTGYVSTGMTFVDLRTGASVSLPLPAAYAPSPLTVTPSVRTGFVVVPRAWNPAGDTLLVEVSDSSSQSAHTFATMALDIAGALPNVLGEPVVLPAPLPAGLATRSLGPGRQADTATRYFWSASGPRVLLQDPEGARVYDFATQQALPLVEATAVGSGDAGLDVVAGTEQAFAWAVQCFGFAETNCRAQLRRLTTATGAVDVVATADKPRPFAVSPDGKQIVLADDTSIYLKMLAP